MKRLVFWLVGLALAVGLVGCSTAPIKQAYTAAGDGSKPAELRQTRTFKPDDDLNVVVRLGLHTRTQTLKAVFRGPNGESYTTDPIEVDKTVGEVLLGMDWEATRNVGWTVGEWQVDIYVQDAREKTLTFTVEQTVAPIQDVPEG